MRGQWVIHEKGAEKILTVADRFFESRRRYWAQRFPDQDFDCFRPWMSRQALGEAIARQLMIAPMGKPFPDTRYLQHANAIYTAASPLLQPRRMQMSPCADLYEKIPGSFEEQKFAYDFLLQGPPWMAQLAERLILEIFPGGLDGQPYDGLGGHSEAALMGLIVIGKMTEPFARLKAVISLAHELGHQALMILQTIENMAGEHRDTLVYSGVREVERPFLASLHAAVALAYMLEAGDLLLATLTLDEAERNYLHSLRERHRQGLQKGHAALAKFDVPPICKEVLVDLSHFAT